MSQRKIFNKKATSLALAVAIAVTPVTTPALSIFNDSVSAEAASGTVSVDDIAGKFIVFYQNLSEDDVASINAARGNISQIDSNYANIAGSLKTALDGKLDSTDKTALLGILQGISNVVYSDYADSTELKNAITAFESDYAGDFDTLFGTDVHASDLFELFGILDDSITSAVIQSAIDTSLSYETAITNEINTAIASSSDLTQLDNKLKDNLGIGAADLFTLQRNLNDNILDTDKSARSALLVSATHEKGVSVDYNENDVAVGATDVPFEIKYSSISVGDDSRLKWEVDGPAGATFSGNKLDIPSAGTYTVTVKLKNDDLAIARTEFTVGSTGGGIGGGGTVPADEGSEVVVDNDTVTVEKGTNEEGKTEVTVKVDPAKLGDLLGKATDKVGTVTINVEKAAGEVAVVKLPSKAFEVVKEANPNAVVEIKSTEGVYRLPANEINLSELASDLGVTTTDNLVIDIQIYETDAADDVIENKNLNAVSKVVEFKVNAVAGDKTKEIKYFSSYVERSIAASKAFDADHSVAVRINENGSVTPVPTVFDGNSAVFKSVTNSTYTVVESNVSFDDVSNKHWAKDHINKLASKLLIKGRDVDEFDPEGNTTRVELAILLVRALGLSTSDDYDYKNNFKDVKGNEWYINDLMAAVEAGLIKGEPGGYLSPNDGVTREEAAAMFVRAFEFAGYDASKLNTSKKITSYKDVKKIGSWSKKSVELLLQSNVMGGKPGGNFDPQGVSTRAEVAKMLDNTLQYVNLINK